MNLVISQEHLPEYKQLIEECLSVISELSFGQALAEIEKRHYVGKLIVGSDLYQKYSKGSGEFLDRIAKDLNKSRSWIYESVRFFEKYPDLSAFIGGFLPEKKIVRWADVRKVLPAPKECEHQKTEAETIQITRVRCLECGKVVNEERARL